MLDFDRRGIPQELHKLHILARAGLSRPSPKSSVVDISKLLESRDSESPAENKSTSSTAQTSTAGATANSTPVPPRSYASGPGGQPFPPPVANVASALPSGGVHKSPPPQLPPVSSIQTGPLLQPSPYGNSQPYVPPIQSYYSTPPQAPALPSLSPHSLPPISASVPQPLPGAILPAVPLPPTTIPAKRGAEAPAHASPPQKKHHGKWTEEEDNLAIELRRRGMKWEDISKRIPGRSAISCRLRYQNYSEKRPNWDEEKKNKLARLYNRFKREMWEMVATEMGLPWRAVEAMHWQMGQEEMASRANVPVFQPHGNSNRSTKSPPAPEAAPSSTPQLNNATRTRRSSSTSSRRARADSAGQSDRPSFLQLAPVSEGENQTTSINSISYPATAATLFQPVPSFGVAVNTPNANTGSPGGSGAYSDLYATPSPPVQGRTPEALSTTTTHQRSGSLSPREAGPPPGLLPGPPSGSVPVQPLRPENVPPVSTAVATAVNVSETNAAAAAMASQPPSR